MIYINQNNGNQMQITQHGSRIHVRMCGEEIGFHHERKSLDLFTMDNEELASMINTYRKLKTCKMI